MAIFKPLIVDNVYSGGPVAQPGRAPPLHGPTNHRDRREAEVPGSNPGRSTKLS